MFGVFLAVSFGIIVGFAFNIFVETGSIWSSVLGVLGFFIFQITLGLVMRKKMMVINTKIQDIMQRGQGVVQRKMQAFQSKPIGNMKTMQGIMEKEQAKFINEALVATDELEPFCKWSPMLKKQIATMKMQFYYQLKDYKKVDELIPKAMYFDVTTACIKMIRLFKNEKLDELKKVFGKFSKKFKSDETVMVYALYSWILVKKLRDIDAAVEVLVEGKKKTSDEHLSRNLDALINGKVKQFSNAQLGDAWYGLQLEEPKMQKQRQQRGGGQHRRF